MSRLTQTVALGAYRVAEGLHLSRWPFFERCYVPLYFGYKKYCEDPFARLTREYPELFIDGHILDVGANIGYTALVFAKSLSPGYHVYAFEPESANYRLLQRQIEKSGLKEKIIAVQAAVGAQDGAVDLWLNPVHPADHRVLTEAFRTSRQSDGPNQPVAMRSLDSFTGTLKPPNVSFIKVDVQGYEEAVCQGMTEILKRNPQAVVALEYSPVWMKRLGFDPGKVLDFFQARGYRLYALTRRAGLEDSTREAVETISEKKGYCDLVFSQHALT